MELKSYARFQTTNTTITPAQAQEVVKHKRPMPTSIVPNQEVSDERPSIGRRSNNPIGAFASTRNVSYTPRQLAAYYGFPTGFDGQGTKVAVIELGGGYVQSDLDKYFTSLGLKVKPVVFHSIDGAKNSPGNPNGPDSEVMLDLCVIGAMAPGTELHCYMAPNSESGFLNAINQAITDKMTCISISWGAPENQWSSSALSNYNAAFQRAVDAGITVTAASGDSGSSDGVPGNNVDFPASSPLVLGCGGTSVPSLTGMEIVWNDGGGIATGGGVSSVFAIPSYQSKTTVPGGTRRGVPDVAGNADPSTGWTVIVDGQNYVIGGTSAVAPMWAALAACLSQALGRNVGFLNANLYALTNWYRDITSGNNGTYAAKIGYDCCTGMGVPIGTKLLAALQGVSPAPTPAPTPNPVPTPTPVPTPSPSTTTRTIVITGTNVVVKIDGKVV